MHDELKVLIDLQREQNALLKKYLWRLRFSLLSLLLLTTATAVGLGILVYKSPSASPTTPTGTLQVWTGMPPAAPQPGGKTTPSNPYQLLPNSTSAAPK